MYRFHPSTGVNYRNVTALPSVRNTPFAGYGLSDDIFQKPATIYIPPRRGQKGIVGDMQLTFKLSSGDIQAWRVEPLFNPESWGPHRIIVQKRMKYAGY